MLATLSLFRQRLYDEWLPAYCAAAQRLYATDGFKDSSIDNLTEHDAHWFMRAIDSGLVSHSAGDFSAKKSATKEVIFWEGSKSLSPRPITLWLEPIITIGAIAQLCETFGWPKSLLGAQSKTWAFDLVAYDAASDKEDVVCEVKKTQKEITNLIKHMRHFSCLAPLKQEPKNSIEKNAYRKVVGIRASWPRAFWALGPGNFGSVFIIKRTKNTELFELTEVPNEVLAHPSLASQ